MPNRINYELEMEKTIRALEAEGRRPGFCSTPAARPVPAPLWNAWPMIFR